MNFFEHQDRARDQSKFLIALYVLAVAVIVAAINFVFHLLFEFNDIKEFGSMSSIEVHLVISCVALGAIILGSLIKSYQISRHGGISIALDLGGKPIDAMTSDKSERVLLNVVEEMAIASGVPVPQVFVIEEAGINAFAAGFSIHDAVVGITRGSLESLSRDELQGVIAHEFSHIFNGDMRLNMRLIGVLHGILLISLAGRLLLYSPSRSYSRKGRGGGLPLLGLFLLVIGSIGVLFGRLIQAAVSRQREYLADASAVQFTRNPSGIAGALKKIGGFSLQGSLKNPHANEMSHFFLASPFLNSLGGPLSTHPPLEKRIRAIDPSFRGEFTRPSRLLEDQPEAPEGISQFQQSTFSSNSVLENIGSFGARQVSFAQALLAGISPFLRHSSREAFSAQAIVFALFLDENLELRKQQLKRLQEYKLEDLLPVVEKSFRELSQLGRQARLPLLELCLPALKTMSQAQINSFLELVTKLVLEDSKVQLFEFSLMKILMNSLEPPEKSRKGYIEKSALKLQRAADVLVSALLHAGSTPLSNERYEKVKRESKLKNLKILPEQDCAPKPLNEAMMLWRNAKPKMKQRLILACIASVEADGKVTAVESELLRAIADSLEIPISPLVN